MNRILRMTIDGMGLTGMIGLPGYVSLTLEGDKNDWMS
jgi:hypothetical protein